MLLSQLCVFLFSAGFIARRETGNKSFDAAKRNFMAPGAAFVCFWLRCLPRCFCSGGANRLRRFFGCGAAAYGAFFVIAEEKRDGKKGARSMKYAQVEEGVFWNGPTGLRPLCG